MQPPRVELLVLRKISGNINCPTQLRSRYKIKIIISLKYFFNNLLSRSRVKTLNYNNPNTIRPSASFSLPAARPSALQYFLLSTTSYPTRHGLHHNNSPLRHYRSFPQKYLETNQNIDMKETLKLNKIRASFVRSYSTKLVLPFMKSISAL